MPGQIQHCKQIEYCSITHHLLKLRKPLWWAAKHLQSINYMSMCVHQQLGCSGTFLPLTAGQSTVRDTSKSTSRTIIIIIPIHCRHSKAEKLIFCLRCSQYHWQISHVFVLHSFSLLCTLIMIQSGFSFGLLFVWLFLFLVWIRLMCVLPFAFVASAFDRWISPWGSIKCIVSFHLISSHHLRYGVLQENINNINVRWRWVCLQVANI